MVKIILKENLKIWRIKLGLYACDQGSNLRTRSINMYKLALRDVIFSKILTSEVSKGFLLRKSNNLNSIWKSSIDIDTKDI
ncbi:unnamed protein product [Heterobilharzia americana]|nr:unnamed protein product [Heterobilharzia americana]